MTEIRHHHHPDTGPHPPSGANSIPYWKRAHLDWRLWVAVVFVFVALGVYIVTVDLSLVPQAPRPSLSIGK